MQDMAARKDKVQDIAACVCLGEGWKTVKKKKKKSVLFLAQVNRRLEDESDSTVMSVCFSGQLKR